MTEAEAERICDQRVMRRLSVDSAYRNAENAQDQADREAEITADEWNRLAPLISPKR